MRDLQTSLERERTKIVSWYKTQNYDEICFCIQIPVDTDYLQKGWNIKKHILSAACVFSEFIGVAVLPLYKVVAECRFP